MRNDLRRVQDVLSQVGIAPCELRVVVVIEDQIALGTILVDDELTKSVGRAPCLAGALNSCAVWPRSGPAPAGTAQMPGLVILEHPLA